MFTTYKLDLLYCFRKFRLNIFKLNEEEIQTMIQQKEIMIEEKDVDKAIFVEIYPTYQSFYIVSPHSDRLLEYNCYFLSESISINDQMIQRKVAIHQLKRPLLIPYLRFYHQFYTIADRYVYDISETEEIKRHAKFKRRC